MMSACKTVKVVDFGYNEIIMNKLRLGNPKCNALSMFLLFPENRKSIPKFLSGKNF